MKRLSNKEMRSICGGDNFMYNLGRSVGAIGRGIWDFVTSGDYKANETLMNCI
ncbi:MAG: hypothetical protein ACK5IJ_01790 [Mangrovibacterium sp.]